MMVVAMAFAWLGKEEESNLVTSGEVVELWWK